MRVKRREFVRVIGTLMSWSNENKSCMRVDESRETRVCMRAFTGLLCLSQARTKVARGLTRVEKREFV